MKKKKIFIHLPQGLSLFCKTHPDLLHLYFNTSLAEPQDDEVDYSIGDGDFALPKLITLGYYSTSGPSEGNILTKNNHDAIQIN